MSNELIVITTYFNPCGYKSRRVNYDKFIKGLKHNGVKCITIECAFGDQPFDLPNDLNIIRVRTDSILWQKERLLNLAASWVPERYKYIAWLDCDIGFENFDWVNDCVHRLKSHQIVQVFEKCVRLNQDGTGREEPDVASFGMIQYYVPQSLSPEIGRYDVHGHTGYGWAMRRSLFEQVGLYEGAISGSADHFMAHAIFDKYGFCIENALKHDQTQIQHLKEWGKKFYELAQGDLGYVPGRIVHFWHGSTQDRRYFLRMHEITDLGYNPYLDIIAPPGRPLEWSPMMNKQGLKDYFIQYFTNRREDGDIIRV